MPRSGRAIAAVLGQSQRHRHEQQAEPRLGDDARREGGRSGAGCVAKVRLPERVVGRVDAVVVIAIGRQPGALLTQRVSPNRVVRRVDDQVVVVVAHQSGRRGDREAPVAYVFVVGVDNVFLPHADPSARVGDARHGPGKCVQAADGQIARRHIARNRCPGSIGRGSRIEDFEFLRVVRRDGRLPFDQLSRAAGERFTAVGRVDNDVGRRALHRTNTHQQT